MPSAEGITCGCGCICRDRYVLTVVIGCRAGKCGCACGYLTLKFVSYVILYSVVVKLKGKRSVTCDSSAYSTVGCIEGEAFKRGKCVCSYVIARSTGVSLGKCRVCCILSVSTHKVMLYLILSTCGGLEVCSDIYVMCGHFYACYDICNVSEIPAYKLISCGDACRYVCNIYRSTKLVSAVCGKRRCARGNCSLVFVYYLILFSIVVKVEYKTSVACYYALNGAECGNKVKTCVGKGLCLYSRICNTGKLLSEIYVISASVCLFKVVYHLVCGIGVCGEVSKNGNVVCGHYEGCTKGVLGSSLVPADKRVAFKLGASLNSYGLAVLVHTDTGKRGDGCGKLSLVAVDYKVLGSVVVYLKNKASVTCYGARDGCRALCLVVGKACESVKRCCDRSLSRCTGKSRFGNCRGSFVYSVCERFEVVLYFIGCACGVVICTNNGNVLCGHGKGVAGDGYVSLQYLPAGKYVAGNVCGSRSESYRATVKRRLATRKRGRIRRNYTCILIAYGVFIRNKYTADNNVLVGHFKAVCGNVKSCGSYPSAKAVSLPYGLGDKLHVRSCKAVNYVINRAVYRVRNVVCLKYGGRNVRRGDLITVLKACKSVVCGKNTI